MTKESLKEEMREVLKEEFSAVEFPVSNKLVMASNLSSGPGTKFETENISVSAMELATIAGKELDFPYDSVEDLLDDSISILDNKDFFEDQMA